ncbi:MAG: ABC transporter permease [Chloroflexota bacterium]|nr:ABC transporter permease [Chloroflexota bacterium]MDE2852835.1 ABC transporter permease [Chloroflexota bacterium]MDE2949041.1 ABC transporter permease [Chloroflexota bacterium]
MLLFLRRRFLFFFFTYLLSSLTIFFLLRVLPGDPARVIAGGREATEDQIAEIRAELGLNASLPEQYVNWLGNFLGGQWGDTIAFRGANNYDLIIERSVNSARLAAVALLMSVPLSLALGVIAGLFENKLPDILISLLTLSVVSLPEFVTGLFLINIVSLRWGRGELAQSLGWWFPASSAVPANASFGEMLPALWLPAVAATLTLLAYISRLTRAGVIEELKRDYVRTAALKGIPWRAVIWRHVLRNALLPTITVIAISISWLISGLVVIEYVFGFPGLGSLLIAAIERRDLLLAQAIAMVTVTVILFANLAADVAYALLNPRVELA